MQSKFIWMNGKLVSFEQATVHVLNPTMHYGTGVFEGIRCYQTSKGSAVFRLKEHLQRLIESTQIVGLYDYPYTAQELYRAVHMTIRANGFSECYIRPLVYMEGPLTLDLDDWQPMTSIAVWEWAPFLGKESVEKGIRATISSFTRHHPNIMMTKAKVSGNYVNSTFAKTLAKRSGFDEVILLDPQGFISECSGENLFMVRDNILYTPPRSTVLEGITRDTVITLAQDAGLQVVEEPISRDQLYIADEVFVSGTAAEIVPVREIDYRRIRDGRRGAVTRLLQDLFYDAVRGLGIRSYAWLDFVDETVMAV
jgi:branched-chain amino acid aminotransferase